MFPSIDGTKNNILWKYEYLRTLMFFQIYLSNTLMEHYSDLWNLWIKQLFK